MNFVKTEEEAKQLCEKLGKWSKEYYTFKCEKCGEESKRRVRKSTTTGFYGLLCTECKRKQTSIEKFGVDCNFKLDSVKEQIKNTMKERYGVEHPYQNPELFEKLKQTKLERYGVEWFNNVEKTRQTCKEKYGENYTKLLHQKSLDSYKEHVQEEKKTLGEVLEREEVADFFGKGITWANLILKQSGLGIKGVRSYYLKKQDLPLLENWVKENRPANSSLAEKELLEFVKSVYPGEVFSNVKNIIPPKELDIYLPERKLAIEFNGIYWHSDALLEEKNLAKTFHIEKTNLCKEKGIELIHVFEDDWLYKKEIVKSIIESRLGVFKEKVYARKCILQKLKVSEYREFLIENHLQGYSPADVKLGLFYNGELVECIGIKSKGNHSKEPELVRLCTKKGVQVLGGFSKLLKHSGFQHLTSYVDIGTFSGKGYQSSGFEIVKQNPPTFFWCDFGQILRIPRYQYMKKTLKSKLENYDENKTEVENMYTHGFSRIWNCGTYKVVWHTK